MTYLVLSILFSTLTVSFFKVFEHKNVDTLQAIVFNYLACSIIGNLLSNHTIFSLPFYQAPWFGYSAILGFLFITIFYAIAKTAQTISVAASMVAAKLSVVLPVLFAVMIYHERLSIFQVIGILFSLLSVYLISGQAKAATKFKSLFLLAMVFFGSGAIDTMLNYVEQHFIPPYEAANIITSVFFMAFLLGGCFLLTQIAQKKSKFVWSNAAWGLALGIPNYFSMFFLVKTLETFNGSFIFPVNNIGIVVASTLAAYLFFKENLSSSKLIGLGLAILSIVLLSLV
jgi:drug/metabolite transporter (DMT)-like permease